MVLSRRFRLGGGYTGLFVHPPFSTLGAYDPARSPVANLLTQFHCHTNQSDGSYTPATIVANYLGAGYDALAITDHDKVTSQPAGITYAVVANELSPTTQHIISVNSSYTRGALTGAQAILDGIEAAGGKAHIAHPNWSVGMTYAELAALTSYMGIEIHNGKVVNGSGQNPVTYPGYAMARWDELLTNVRTDLWGFAVDDLHTIGPFETYDMGRLKVFPTTASVAGIVAAVARGDFVADVANHGVTPAYPTRTTDGISVTCTGATRIEAYGSGGALLQTTAGTSLSYDFAGDERYVRLVAVGDYTEGFGSSLSDRWSAVSGTWTATGGVLDLASTTTGKLVLRRHREGDFTAQVDLKLAASTTNDRAQFMFHALNATHYYMIHVGRSSVTVYNNAIAIGKTTTDGFSSALDSDAFTASVGTWYTMKMAYTSATGRIQAKVWDRSGSEPTDWMVDASDTGWGHGAFGFRAGGNAQFDNLYINGFRTYYQPVPVTVD